MAATGYTPISLYYSTTASAVPTAGNLVAGELAININDGKLYFKNSSNVVTLLAQSGAASPVTTISFGSTGLTPSTATSGAITVAGTLATTNGGTGLTSFTANRIFYASSTSAIGQSANLTFDGTTLTAANFIDSSLTSGRVIYATTGGNLTDSANLTFDGTTLSAAGLSDSGNLTFTGTGNRITGDMSNATLSNRIAFQSSTTNGVSVLSLLPNGTSITSGIACFAAADPTNTSYGLIADTSGQVTFRAAISGTGTYEPMTFYTGGSERLRIDTSGNVGIGTNTPTAQLQIAGSSSVAALKVPNIEEVATVSATAATGTINYDITTQSVLYYTSNASANWTVNFRGSSGTSLNTLMQTGESISVSFLVTQGATAYYNSSVQVDGTTSGVTTKWQGSAPTSGNASSIDSYTYVIIKTGSATFTVFATQTKFS